MPVDLYEGLYIGGMEVDVRPFPNPGRPIQLAVSRDGRCWTRVANRCPFIEPPSPRAWDADVGPEPKGFVRPATCLFIYGDEVRMYYKQQQRSRRLEWRRNGHLAEGWFCFVAYPRGLGRTSDATFIPMGPELRLNIDTSQGEDTVRVGDFQGSPLRGWKIDQPSEPIRGDRIDTVVRWADSDFDQRVGKATTLRIRMRDADLYSFWTECG